MSQYQEGCQLRFDEVAAVLSLAGKKSVVGFQTEQIQSLTPEKLWNACCRLIGERMMTQIDGQLRLCRELVDVMKPICQARVVLALTPASDLKPQIIYYCAEGLVSMEPTPYGRYLLTPLGEEGLSIDLRERMELEEIEESTGTELEIDVAYADPREKLLASAQFVLEQLDVDTGLRKNWLRLVWQGMDQWLQWTQGETVCCEALTEQLLSQRLQALLRGETP